MPGGRLSVTPAIAPRDAPCLGEHTREVLRDWAGLDDAAIDALDAAGILSTVPPGS